MEIALRRIVEEVYVPDCTEYITAVEDILYNGQFQLLAEYPQHGNTSCLSHSVAVSYLSWQTCQKLGLRAVQAARGGLLHDFFLYDWHKRYAETGRMFHGFTHPRTALENAEEQFHLTDAEKDIILKHMWPLTVLPPKYKEGYVVLYHDKVCSFFESIGKPIF